MKTIFMSEEETRRWDEDDLSVLVELRQMAQRLREGLETVEIRTHDDIMVDVVQD